MKDESRPCGFCGPGFLGIRGKCYDKDGNCRGTYLKASKGQDWLCPCSELNHPGRNEE